MSVKNQKNFFNDIDDHIIGVDEVGRGALCGPVVSCCVLLKKEIFENVLVNEINDSKKISPRKREVLSNFIKRNSIYSLGEASNTEIDNTIVNQIRKFNITDVKVRSPLTCDALRSVCRKCYLV